MAAMAWKRALGDAEISDGDKAVLRLLSEAAIKDLPQKIQDPANYPKIKRELHLLKNSLALLKEI